jgi:hypothetical protein
VRGGEGRREKERRERGGSEGGKAKVLALSRKKLLMPVVRRRDGS